VAKRRLRSDAGTHRKKQYIWHRIARRPLHHRCRCSNKKCRQRKTFAKHPSHYARGWPVCDNCGSRYTVDWYRQLRETRINKCECGAAHYPHRAGWCAKVGKAR